MDPMGVVFPQPKLLLEGSIGHLCHRPWSIAEDGRHLKTFHVWGDGKFLGFPAMGSQVIE